MHYSVYKDELCSSFGGKRNVLNVCKGFVCMGWRRKGRFELLGISTPTDLKSALLTREGHPGIVVLSFDTVAVSGASVGPRPLFILT